MGFTKPSNQIYEDIQTWNISMGSNWTRSIQPSKKHILPRVAVRKHPALAVHGTLVACVPVKLSKCLNSFLITPRIETKLVSVDRSSPAIPAIAQGILLYSAKAEQRPKLRQSKPTDHLHLKKTFSIFQFLSPVFGNALRITQYTREAKNRLFSVQTVKLQA